MWYFVTAGDFFFSFQTHFTQPEESLQALSFRRINEKQC